VYKQMLEQIDQFRHQGSLILEDGYCKNGHFRYDCFRKLGFYGQKEIVYK